MWKYTLGFYFIIIFLHHHSVPFFFFFFFFFSAQAFTKWPPVFLGRNATYCSRGALVCGTRGRVRDKRGCGVCLSGGISGFGRFICVWSEFLSTKESCDFCYSDILSRLSVCGARVGVVAEGRGQGEPALPVSPWAPVRQMSTPRQMFTEHLYLTRCVCVWTQFSPGCCYTRAR